MRSTKDTIICINKSEKTFLIQDLKNHEVFCKSNDNIAKGVNKIKILIITYLKEYVKTKFNRDIVRVAFINPSNENISRVELSVKIKSFIHKISSEKQIFLLNKFSPIPRIAKVIYEQISNNFSITKYNTFENKLIWSFYSIISNMR